MSAEPNDHPRIAQIFADFPELLIYLSLAKAPAWQDHLR
jgi:hypothetical protein